MRKGVQSKELEEFRSSGVQEFRSSGVQEFRSSGVQEFRSSGWESRVNCKQERFARVHMMCKQQPCFSASESRSPELLQTRNNVLSPRLNIVVRTLLLLIVSILGLGLTLQAQTTTRFESGPSQVSLLELYTSEGCSSCPPAEAWLSALSQSPELWKAVVPVAFHVDYWDNLGWKDWFSSREFTQRQRRYAANWGSGSVYTPAFILN